MSFKPETILEFLSEFEIVKDSIRNFKGCMHLKLLQDKNNPEVFFTYSHWDNDQSLQNYRNSDLFNGVWEQTKIKFNDRPQVWSLDAHHTLL